MRFDTEEICRQKVNRVIDYINANLRQPFALDKLADRVYISQRQLFRIMRPSLNESLYSYTYQIINVKLF